MTTTRLEAFSDAVIAIVMTIMVLEFRVPEGADWRSLTALAPIFFTYVLSFVFVAIYWNNHHHLMHATRRVDGRVLWANMHLLFWLSLVPFVTHWMGDHHLAPVPTAVYGVVLLMAAVSYTLLVSAIVACEGPHSTVREALGSDLKGKLSLAIYASAIVAAFLNQWISDAFYVTVALMWLVPDRRIARRLDVDV